MFEVKKIINKLSQNFSFPIIVRSLQLKLKLSSLGRDHNPYSRIVTLQNTSTLMNISDRVRWTTADLKLLPDNGNRYEIIDGELFVTRAPHWGHQRTTGNIYQDLNL